MIEVHHRCRSILESIAAVIVTWQVSLISGERERNVRLNSRVLDDPGTKIAYNVEVNTRFEVSTR